MLTLSTDAYQRALHLSRLMPLGKHSEAKKQAVKRWHEAILLMLKNKND